MEGFQHYHQQAVKKDRDPLISNIIYEGREDANVTLVSIAVTTFRQRVYMAISQRPIWEAKPRFRVKDNTTDCTWRPASGWPGLTAGREWSVSGNTRTPATPGVCRQRQWPPWQQWLCSHAVTQTRAPMREQSLIKQKVIRWTPQGAGRRELHKDYLFFHRPVHRRCHRVPIWTLGDWQINPTYPIPAKDGINVFKFFNIH